MFENLKKKLKKAISAVSGKIDEPEPEVIEEEILEDAQAEEQVEEIIEEAEKAEAVEPVEDEVHEAEVEDVIEETLEEPVPAPELELEKESEKTEELEKELVEDEQAEEDVKEVLEEIKEDEPKSEEDVKLQEKTDKVIEEVLKEEPKEEEIEEAKKELDEPPVINLDEAEMQIIQEAEKEAEAEMEKHTDVLKKEGEGFFKRMFKKKEKKKEHKKEVPAPISKKEAPKATLIERLRNKKLSEKDMDSILWDLELALIENDVAKEVTEKINSDIKKELLGSESSRKSVEAIITDALKKSVTGILSKEPVDVIQQAKDKTDKPYVILFFGFNGTGKTMTIGKFAKLLKDAGLKCVMAAGDTFRAAAIEQLEIHAKNLDVPIIKQERGSDSAAVIYDAIEHAKAKGIDVVLADTAGRSSTNTNLMDELKKVVRVNNPDLKIFVGDALTGNDAADQAKLFHETGGIDAAVLTKVDCDAKGGACLSVSYMTDAPIIYLGTGQDYGDMEKFEPEWFLDKVF